MSDQELTGIEKLKAEAVLVPLNNAEELRDWMDTYLGIKFPMGVVYPESTHGPVEAMWEIYRLMKTGESADCPQVTMLASRDSFKTLGAAAIEVLCMVHFRISLAHMAAIQSQSEKAIQYINSFFRKLRPYLEYNGWRKHSDNRKMVEWLTDEGENVYIKIVIATIAGANSEHVPMLCIKGSTKVRTDKGSISATDLYNRLNNGEQIKALSYNFKKDIVEYKDIAKQWKNKKENYLKIRTTKGILEVSHDHLIYVKGRGYIKASELQLGNKLYRKKGDRSYLYKKHGKRKCIVDIKKQIEKYDGISLISQKYQNNTEKLKLNCERHGIFYRQWGKIQDRIKKGLSPCTKCNSEHAIDKIRLDKQTIKEDANAYGFELVDFITHNKTAKDIIRLKCSKGHIFDTIINNFRNNHSCTKCGCVSSNIQNEIYNYVKSIYSGSVILNDRQFIKPLEIDIFMPDLNYGIELDGLYWHCETVKKDIKSTNMIKINKANKQNLHMNFFYEDEWKDEIKQKIIKSIIKNIIKPDDLIKIRASKCQIIRIDKNKDFKEFFQHNHLSGHTNASVAYGLVFNGKLVSCMSFRKSIASSWEIARFASLFDYKVYGAASKLLQSFQEQMKVNEIISYSDNRLGCGNVYKQLGFEEITQTKEPSYYYTDFKTRLFRTKCKRINDPEILKKYPTERDQALGGIFSKKYLGHNRALHRIYDYGHKKWKKKTFVY